MWYHVKQAIAPLPSILCPAPSPPPLTLPNLVHLWHPHIHLYYLASIPCPSNYPGSHHPTSTALHCTALSSMISYNWPNKQLSVTLFEGTICEINISNLSLQPIKLRADMMECTINTYLILDVRYAPHKTTATQQKTCGKSLIPLTLPHHQRQMVQSWVLSPHCHLPSLPSSF